MKLKMNLNELKRHHSGNSITSIEHDMERNRNIQKIMRMNDGIES